jgi:serine/threonine protein kinase
MEATAAGDDIWSAVRDSLRGQQLPPDCLGSGDSALESATGGGASFSHATVLKLLAPTDDDRMLGRLGMYEVVGVIGSGGMGVVLKAFDAALNRYVAIKVLAPHLGSGGAARKRFSREAQAAAAVVHDNVMEIYGVADVEGLPYLVMPYVRGPSLQRRLDDDGPLALVEILRIAVQAATGLAAAHAQGLVHRDVKPANILLADGVERVKLTDFGLARAADDASLTRTGIIAGTPQYMSPEILLDADDPKTLEGSVMGTPQYMSPEQARGESVDQRSDLFSLGSVLYAMSAGRAPFRAETSYGVLRRVTDEEPRPIREINSDIPEWLCRIIARLMSKQPHDRFASAREVGELLEECLAHVQQPAAVPLPASLVSHAGGRRSSVKSLRRGAIAMLATGCILLGTVFWQVSEAPDAKGSKRSAFPKAVHIGRSVGSVMLVHDDMDPHYIFYHAGAFETAFRGSQNTHSLSWMDDGGITLKGGKAFGYHRESTDPFHLRVNGKEYDLRQGRVLELRSDDSVEQFKLFPTLPTANAPDALAKLIASTRGMNEEPVTLEKIRLQLDAANAQLLDLLKTHAPTHALVVDVIRSVEALQRRIKELTNEEKASGTVAPRPPAESEPKTTEVIPSRLRQFTARTTGHNLKIPSATEGC